MDEVLASLKGFLKPEIIWFLIGLVLLLSEFVLPGLIIFFFGIGAMVVALVCFLTDVSVNIQLLIFIGSSILLLIFLRKWLKGIFMGRVVGGGTAAGDLKEFIGERVVVKESITPKAGGRVEFHGTSWQAEADEEIPVGTVVRITGKANITLTVKPL